ncbi:hypothetical protein C8Q73DRAFT_2427 [Cubamyces lactineus]|nr:hypothetical protein C8Q73DRAFT_2427 [Cubamyces lactineus]
MMESLFCLRKLKARSTKVPVSSPDTVDHKQKFGSLTWMGDIHPGNSTITISQLPPELLAQCFLWYIRTVYYWPCNKNQGTNPRPYAWLVIRHVCRHWRHVALTHPELSSYIYLTSTADLIQDLLDHSKSAPLRVCESGHWEYGRNGSARKLVLDHFARVETALFHFSSAIPNPVPSLESTIYPSRRPAALARSLHLSFWTLPLSTPAAFVYFDFPYLEEFTCVFGSVSIFGRMLGLSLRRLELRNCLHISALDPLIAMFASTRNLEELVLRDAFRGYVVSMDTLVVTYAPDQTVTLPRLRTLRIIDTDLSQVLALLNRLQYPAATSVSFQGLEFLAEPPLVISMDMFFSHLRQRTPDSSPPPLFRSVSIHRPSLNHIELHIWREHMTLAELEAKREAGDATASFSFVCPDIPSGFVSSLLSHAPLADVQSAKLSEAVVSGVMSWGSVLQALVSLEELEVDYEVFNNTGEDSQLSSEPYLGFTSSDNDSRMFPSLQRLRVRERRHEHSALPPAENHPPSALQPVARELCSRARKASSQAVAERDAGLSIEMEVVDFHGHDADVCICGLQIYLDEHPDETLPGDDGAPEDGLDEGAAFRRTRSSRLRSWVASHMSRLRRRAGQP